MKIVEQVNIDGNIVMDNDTSLPPRELYRRLYDNFPGIYKDQDGMICGTYNGKKYAIRVKNVTYLGHPHPKYKKRIQIPSDLQVFYERALAKGRIPLLMGIYSCEDNLLFCDFNIEDFVHKKANNSSAHVYTEDLAEATLEKYFHKEDYFGNKITVVSPKGIFALLDEKMAMIGPRHNNERRDVDYNIVENFGQEKVAEEEQKYLTLNSQNFVMPIPIQNAILDFFKDEEKNWNGIDCYKIMIDANYKNKFQPEWPGFFLEYRFEKYINENNLNHMLCYLQDKRQGGIDLDLFFPSIRMYGDLKAHSSHSKGIQGNDRRTVLKIIDNPNQENHIYYIVCEHDTEKDSLFDYEVTQFWNTAKGKDDLMSYSRRMKNNIDLTKVYILDINPHNKPYLSVFRQGINSNGKPREPKIMIDHEKLSHFVLTEKEL